MTFTNGSDRKIFKFFILITLKVQIYLAQIEYTDDQGRYIFDAPPSIRNRQRNTNSIIETNPFGIIAPSQGRQTPVNTIQNNQQPAASTQAPVIMSMSTQRPRNPQLRSDIRNCLKSCPTTTEFNPACGNDGISYSNPQKLSCAQRCGQDVRFVRHGRCRPFAPIQF